MLPSRGEERLKRALQINAKLFSRDETEEEKKGLEVDDKEKSRDCPKPEGDNDDDDEYQ
jgi:hypothetical protein